MRDSVSVRAAAKLDPGAAAKHDPGTLITLSTILVLTGWETSGTISTAVSTAERERERDMARETTRRLLDRAEETCSWEYLARTCLEWMDEHDVRAMDKHHGILDWDDDDNE